MDYKHPDDNGHGVCPAYTTYVDGGAICQPGSVQRCAIVVDEREKRDTIKVAFNTKDYKFQTGKGSSTLRDETM